MVSSASPIVSVHTSSKEEGEREEEEEEEEEVVVVVVVAVVLLLVEEVEEVEVEVEEGEEASRCHSIGLVPQLFNPSCNNHSTQIHSTILTLDHEDGN